jgi:hypothetical protein
LIAAQTDESSGDVQVVTMFVAVLATLLLVTPNDEQRITVGVFLF